MATFISYARQLKFEERPDYKYLKGLLGQAMKNNQIEMDYVYDWSSKKGTNEVIPVKKTSLGKPVKEESEE